ncbi:hypothetical protein HDV00_001649 [Rhizophlyctis rosea]|nr:hypothetical protein HDV00_001649 [Rhizophlyctis rosea]
MFWANGFGEDTELMTYLGSATAKPGILQWRGRYDDPDNFWNWYHSHPLEDPTQEPIFNWANAESPGNIRALPGQPGFAMKSGYNLHKIYPPTGAASMVPRLWGIPKESRNATFAYDALMTAFARNIRFQINCPSLGYSNEGEISGYLAAKGVKDYQYTNKAFYDGMMDHVMVAGEPAAHSMSYGEINLLNPMGVAINDILYKNKSIEESLARACQIINFATKPPCTTADLVPYLIDDVKSNSATLMYTWNSTRDCNETLPSSTEIPPAIVAAVPTPYLSTKSGLAKGIDTKVMRAASRLFSMLIFLGAEITLANVIMRVSSQNTVGWPECFGTYWLFAIGFGLVMGSLFVKTYRVDRIFRNKVIGFSLPDMQLVAYIFVILIVEVGLLLVLQFKLDDPSYRQSIRIPLTETYVLQDACPKSSPVGPGLLYAVSV